MEDLSGKIKIALEEAIKDVIAQTKAKILTWSLLIKKATLKNSC